MTRVLTALSIRVISQKMIGLKRAQIEPIGVDIGRDSIKLLQLDRRGQSLAVRAAAREPFPADARDVKDPQALSAATFELIGKMLKQRGFAGKRLVAALPREIAHVRNIRLPQMPSAQLAAALQAEAKALYPFDIGEAQMQFIAAGDVIQGGESRQELIVIAALNREVDAFVNQLHACVRGATVESLDFEPCALFRRARLPLARSDAANEIRFLLDLGLRQSQVIIGKGNDINFFKPIDIGGREMNHAVSRKLGISVEEALALRRRLSSSIDEPNVDVRRDPVRQAVFDATRTIFDELGRQLLTFLRYHAVTFRGPRPQRLLISGGEAHDPQLRRQLSAALSIAVEPAQPFESIDASAMAATDRSGAVSEWAVALGLALKKMAPLDTATAHPVTAQNAVPVDPSPVLAEAIHV